MAMITQTQSVAARQILADGMLLTVLSPQTGLEHPVDMLKEKFLCYQVVCKRTVSNFT